MRLEDQVVNLELAKKLKKLGVKQESLFYWINSKEREEVGDRELCWINQQIGQNNSITSGKEILSRIASAFTVAELFEELPKGFYLGKDSDGGYYCGCNIEFIEDINPEFCKKLDEKFYGWLEDFAAEETEDENPADVLAKMLCYLIENNLINKIYAS